MMAPPSPEIPHLVADLHPLRAEIDHGIAAATARQPDGLHDQVMAVVSKTVYTVRRLQAKAGDVPAAGDLIRRLDKYRGQVLPSTVRVTWSSIQAGRRRVAGMR